MRVMRNVCPVCGGPTQLQTATFEQSCSSCNRIAELESVNEAFRTQSRSQLATILNLEQQLTELREALDTGVNRFYLYEGDPAYETMKAALQESSK